MVNFLIIMILHFIGDFYLPKFKIIACKNSNITETRNNCKQKSLLFIFINSLLYILPFLFLFCVTKWQKVVIIMIDLLAFHFVVGAVSFGLNKKMKQSILLVLDQILHIAILFAFYWLFEFEADFSKYEPVAKALFAILAVIVPPSIFINKLLYDLYPKSEQGKIFEVGSIIGIFERALTLIFACYGDFAAIAIIITIKTWARSNDLKNDEFRNKYLLGTLASLSLALVVFLIYKL